MSNVNITFSTCLYHLKNKHGPDKHTEWMRGFIRIVNRCFLVIYTDEESSKLIIDEIEKIDNTSVKEQIKIVIKPYAKFYNYKHAEYWINNNDNPKCKLYNICDWRLNMLWCEKVHFVNETIECRYFDTEYYGWCDIGYFRNTIPSSAYTNFMRERWPNPDKINALDKNRVYYGCNVGPDVMNIIVKYYSEHFHPTNIDNITGLPRIKYDKRAHFISGGFFITGREKMKWWVHAFQSTLEKYILHNEVLQDDQHLISNCIFTHNPGSDSSSGMNFCIFTNVNEPDPDKLWFMFRDVLL